MGDVLGDTLWNLSVKGSTPVLWSSSPRFKCIINRICLAGYFSNWPPMWSQSRTGHPAVRKHFFEDTVQTHPFHEPGEETKRWKKWASRGLCFSCRDAPSLSFPKTARTAVLSLVWQSCGLGKGLVKHSPGRHFLSFLFSFFSFFKFLKKHYS